MGGLKDEMPVTFWTFLIGSAALAGVFPSRGFWSKDELLVGAWEHRQWLFFVLLAVAVMTAFYMTRCVLLVLRQVPRRGTPARVAGRDDGPARGARGRLRRGRFLRRRSSAPCSGTGSVRAPHDADFVFWVAVVGTLAAAAGILGGYRLYREHRERDPLMAFSRAWNVLQHRYYIDDFYMRDIVLRSATASPPG